MENYTTVTDLASQIGVSRRTVWYWVHRLGFAGQQLGSSKVLLLSDENCEAIKESIKPIFPSHSRSTAALADELGISRQRLWVLIKELGIKRSGTRSAYRLSREDVVRIKNRIEAGKRSYEK